MDRRQALGLVSDELDRQNELWYREDGDFPGSSTKKLTILTEELGEVARAILEGHLSHARHELTQVAAVAVAWIMADWDNAGWHKDD